MVEAAGGGLAQFRCAPARQLGGGGGFEITSSENASHFPVRAAEPSSFPPAHQLLNDGAVADGADDQRPPPFAAWHPKLEWDQVGGSVSRVVRRPPVNESDGLPE